LGVSFINGLIDFYVMELKFLKREKDEVEFELPSLTLAEILRIYLNSDSDVSFAAWRREHFTKNPVMKVKAKDVKTSIKKAVDAIVSDMDGVIESFKKL
jgi:DNA-directed RNA polymerase subunit L